MSAFLSGEMKDTVELNPAGAYVLEKFLSRQERAKLFRSWAGSASMWVKVSCIMSCSYLLLLANSRVCSTSDYAFVRYREATQFGVISPMHRTTKKAPSTAMGDSSLSARNPSFHLLTNTKGPHHTIYP